MSRQFDLPPLLDREGFASRGFSSLRDPLDHPLDAAERARSPRGVHAAGLIAKILWRTLYRRAENPPVA